MPNWSKSIPYRASHAETGAIRLFDRALPILRRQKPDLMMYTEPTDPVFRRMFDVNYSYDEFWLIEELLAWRGPAPQGINPPVRNRKPITAHEARAWMEVRRRAMPKGAVTIHQVDSHDSFWLPPAGQKFRREQFGVEGFRALLFMLATLDGGLMHYATGEQGSEQFMQRVFALREKVPEIREGSCDYLKVDVSDDSVFAASWEAPSGWAIPLTNFGRQAATVRVRLPQATFRWAADARYSVRDVFNNTPVNGKSVISITGRGLEDVTVPLGSLESALLVVRKVTE